MRMTGSVALLGGGGFIGVNLANFFASLSYDVLVVSRSVVERRRFDSEAIQAKAIDVNYTSKVLDAVKDYENIVWLVNDLDPSTAMDSLADDYAFNVAPLIKFLESARSLTALKRFVFISSGGTIYGEAPLRGRLTEDAPKAPISAYGLCKLVSEHYVEYLT